MRKILNASSYSPATQLHYCREIRLLFQFYVDKKPKEINEEMVVDFICYLKNNFNSSRSKIRMVYYSVKYFFSYVIVKHFEIPKKLFPSREFRIPRVLSISEVIRLFNTIENLKTKTILMLIYSSGLRRNEVLNLQVSDIDTGRLKVFIRQGKGSRDRFAILSPKLIPLIEKYLNKYKPELYLFNGKIKGTQLSKSALQWNMHFSCQKAGLSKKYSLHTLRHSFATHLLEMGVSIFSIKELLGHQSINSTLIYLQLNSKQFDSLYSPLDMLPI